MVTINDIAKRAGVSKSTVSRFLNGGSVGKATRLKLQEIVDETAYQPNIFAQSLKAKKTGLIGVIIPRLASSATTSVLKSLDRAAYHYGQRIVIVNTDQNRTRELEALTVLSKQKVDYIIWLVSVYTKEHDELIQQLQTPVIVIGQQIAGLASISYDDYLAGRLIAEHIVSLGHKNILYLGITEADKAVGCDRKRGILDVLSKHTEIKVDQIETQFQFEAAYHLAKEFVLTTEATYIIASTDTIALAVLKAIQESGKRVPQDIAISGFGGYDSTAVVFPSITSVSYPYEEAGRLVLEKINACKDGESIESTVLPVTLKIKQSTVF